MTKVWLAFLCLFSSFTFANPCSSIPELEGIVSISDSGQVALTETGKKYYAINPDGPGRATVTKVRKMIESWVRLKSTDCLSPTITMNPDGTVTQLDFNCPIAAQPSEDRHYRLEYVNGKCYVRKKWHSGALDSDSLMCVQIANALKDSPSVDQMNERLSRIMNEHSNNTADRANLPQLGHIPTKAQADVYLKRCSENPALKASVDLLSAQSAITPDKGAGSSK